MNWHFLLYITVGLLFTGMVYSGKDANKLDLFAAVLATTMWPAFILLATGSWIGEHYRRRL